MQFQEVSYFANIVVETFKIETAFLPTNGYRYEESDHVLVVDMHFPYEEIFVDSATKKMDTGIIHVALAWIITYTWLPDTATPSLSWMVD